jgi:glyoxylase-like metal-dependent hydrolase (beta-lactamase superfamily II)
MMSQALQIHTIVSPLFAENTYIAWLPGRGDALVIDPGLDPESILAFLAEHELRPAALLNTHGHADHIAGNEALKQAFPEAPLLIGVHEAHLLTDAEENLSASFGFPLVSPAADRLLQEGEDLDLAGVRLEVREIPGHSPGHVVFVCHAHRLVFGGDVLFRGGVGRTDFPGGSAEQLFEGIRGKLFTLPDDTVVYPGHGPVTTVGHEKRSNLFLC